MSREHYDRLKLNHKKVYTLDNIQDAYHAQINEFAKDINKIKAKQNDLFKSYNLLLNQHNEITKNVRRINFSNLFSQPSIIKDRMQHASDCNVAHNYMYFHTKASITSVNNGLYENITYENNNGHIKEHKEVHDLRLHKNLLY